MTPMPRAGFPLAPLLLLLVVAALYWRGLSGDFIFDDYPNIVSNWKVQPDALDAAAIASAARGYDGPIDRPLATITFALDHLAWGKDARGYKVTSLAVHLANTLLVFALVRRLAARAGGRTRLSAAGWTAAAVALAWAAHPLLVSSVLYVVQRMETLAVTFVLLGLIAYLRGRQRQIEGRGGLGWLVAGAGLAGAGLLSKETAILFPAYTLGLELTLLCFAAHDPRVARRLKIAYGVATVLAVGVFAGWVLPRYLPDDAYVGRDFNAVERVLTQLRVLPMYLGWMIAPLPDALVFYRDDFIVSRGWLSPPGTLAGGLLLTVLAGAAFALRTRWPLAALGVLWFFGAHLLTSNVFNLEMVFEHRNYFALLGAVVAAADLLARALARWPVPRGAIAVALLVLLCGLTFARASTWGSPLALALEHVARNPSSPRASNDLATLYGGLSGEDATSPYYVQAIAEFERGSRLPRASALSEQGLILLAASAGQPVDARWWDRLVAKLRANPPSAQERSALANLIKQRGEGMAVDERRLAEALTAMLERSDMPPDTYLQFGNLWLARIGDGPVVSLAYDRALAASGRDRGFAADALTNLVTTGNIAAARRFLARAEHQGVIGRGEFVLTEEDAPPEGAAANAPDDGSGGQ